MKGRDHSPLLQKEAKGNFAATSIFPADQSVYVAPFCLLSIAAIIEAAAGGRRFSTAVVRPKPPAGLTWALDFL
jgi:hypothetical protein